MILGVARHYLRLYEDFIDKAIAYLQKQAYSIPLERIELVKPVPVTSQGGITKQNPEAPPIYRLYPKSPENRNEEKALEALFSEHTHEVYEDQDFDWNKKIEIYDKSEEDNYIEVKREIKSKRIYLRPNTYQLDKQRRSIRRLLEKPLSEHEPLLYLFGFSNERYWDQHTIFVPLEWKILTNDKIEGLNEQRAFVQKALATNDFAFMEGPPGSGKTTVIIELIAQLVAQGKRVMLCSATHAAIDNVIERVAGRYKHILSDLIVPVRISRSAKAVKESVRPYLLQNLVRTYLDETLKFLRQNHRLKSQKYLLENLDSKEGAGWMEMLLLESANLVAGTMIGILQHPAIKGNQEGVPFDVMIVDESSKVTFMDFIVPALYAKKWILVGDIKQLPPYIEENYVAEYLNSFANQEKQKAVLERFELKKNLSKGHYDLIIYFTSRDLHKEKQTLLAELQEITQRDERHPDMKIKNFLEKEPHIITLSKEDLDSWKNDNTKLCELNAADIIICQDKGSIRAFLEEAIFVKAVVVGPEESRFWKGGDFTRRQRYLHGKNYTDMDFYHVSPDEEGWAEKVTNQIIQCFGFRDVINLFQKADLELRYLLPGELWDRMEEIKRLVFPSMLEILQRGAGREKDQKASRVLTDGFSDQHKESRFVSLSYQHRMHPDIAETSRKHFYRRKNLHSGTSVLQRPWSDPWSEPRNDPWSEPRNDSRSEPRVLWITNNDPTGNRKNGKIINPTEVKHMEKKLIEFLEWAKDNPKPNDERYELAILTFYRDQEQELREMVRRVTGQKRHYARFQKYNVDIFLYTVDKFQGQEADVVLLGFTKFTPYAHYNSPNRLNVALTRARQKLFLFGHRVWFAEKAKLEALRELATKDTIKTY